jgi:hypothetical protein
MPKTTKLPASGTEAEAVDLKLDETTKTSGEEFVSLLSPKVERSKYATLQDWKRIHVIVDDKIINSYIEMLEKTKWNQTELTNYIIKEYFYLSNSGLFPLLHRLVNENLFDTEDVAVMKQILKALKPISTELLNTTLKHINDIESKHNKKL